MDNDAPATKLDIEGLREQLRGEMHGMETRIMGEIAASETRTADRLTEFTRDIETKLLSAFHAYGRGISNRMHDFEINKRTVEDRLAILEDRVLNIETGHGPGQH